MSFPAQIGVVLPVDASSWASASREELLAAVVLLSEQVAVLSAQVAELSEKLAAATATSRTSSKPPSSNGYRKPPPPALTSRREKSGRRPGGQPGHGGVALRQVEHPDRVVEHRPATCSACAASLVAAPVVALARRQVADLPEQVRLVWTEHRVATCVCPRAGCGARTAAGLADGVPAGVSAPVQYGPGVRAAAAYLMGEHYLPVARAAVVLIARSVVGDRLAPIS